MHTAITKMPHCRWCDKEPEFTPTTAQERVCEHCGSMQDPLLRLRGPGGNPLIKLFVNPDDSLFLEVEKQVPDSRTRETQTVRYTLDPAALAKLGVSVLKTPLVLDGRFIDKGMR